MNNNELWGLNSEDDCVFARLAAGTAQDIDKAVQAAREAFTSYSKTLAAEQEAILCKTAELLEQNRQEFVDILIDEVGSPMGKAQFEVQYAIGCLRAAAGVARQVRPEGSALGVDVGITGTKYVRPCLPHHARPGQFQKPNLAVT